MAALFAALLALSFQRTALNYGNETDLLGGFIPEAQRFLKGEPLAVEYHPPLYAMTLAAAHALTGDWLRAGLLISMVAALLAVLACFRLFDRMHGRASAVGAAVLLVLSYPFLSYSLQATSDLLFLALCLAALCLLASAIVTGRSSGWFWGALFIGLATLTRAHGAAMIGFLLPALKASDRWKGAVWRSAVGLGLPLAAWAAFAQWTGSPLVPQRNYENLALTFYAVGDRTSGDNIDQATEGMTSAWEVLSRNPRRVVRVFWRDLGAGFRDLFMPDLTPFPLCLLAFPALFVLVVAHVRRFGWAWPLTLVAVFLVLNLKAWETRYYLLFVPFMGAAIGLALSSLASCTRQAGQDRALATFLLLSLALAAFATGQRLRREWYGLSQDAQAAARVLAAYDPPAGSVVIARKPHVCYYSGLGCEDLPYATGLEELPAILGEIAARRPADARVFLFYGFIERELRPGLAPLLRGDAGLPWLWRIGEGQERRIRWALFEVVRSRLPAGPGGGSAEGSPP